MLQMMALPRQRVRRVALFDLRLRVAALRCRGPFEPYHR